MARNNPWFKKAADNFASQTIGTGIVPRWTELTPDEKERVRKLWDAWTSVADADGVMDFYGLQALVARTVFVSGEALVRFRPRLMSDGLPVPLQIQVLEPDHLDETVDGRAVGEGRAVRMGIEFNAVGQRVAYWLRRVHPGELLPMSGASGTDPTTVRVPADEVLHIFHRERPGQIRGVPAIASVLPRLYELDAYEDAELVRKKGAALIGGFLKQAGAVDATTPLPFGVNEGQDAAGNLVVALEPGTWPILPPGVEAQFSQPADVGPTYAPWMKQQLHSIAAGLLATYEQLTGDLSDVNFSSIRAGILEARRLIEQWIWFVFIHQFCQGVAERWVEVAVAAGALEGDLEQLKKITWRPARWYWVDPMKDVLAEKEAVRAGFKSRTAVIGEMGDDAESVEREIAEENARADSLGLVFDSDPRRTQGSGAAQPTD